MQKQSRKTSLTVTAKMAKAVRECLVLIKTAHRILYSSFVYLPGTGIRRVKSGQYGGRSGRYGLVGAEGKLCVN